MKPVSLRTKGNTPPSESLVHSVTITYRRHPLRGQCLELVDVVRSLSGDEMIVILRLQNRNFIRLPLAYTDCKLPDAPKSSVSLEDTPHSLSMEGLRQMVKIINSLQRRANLLEDEKGKQKTGPLNLA